MHLITRNPQIHHRAAEERLLAVLEEMGCLATECPVSQLPITHLLVLCSFASLDRPTEVVSQQSLYAAYADLCKCVSRSQLRLDMFQYSSYRKHAQQPEPEPNFGLILANMEARGVIGSLPNGVMIDERSSPGSFSRARSDST
jgi:hypothetical protein